MEATEARLLYHVRKALHLCINEPVAPLVPDVSSIFNAIPFSHRHFTALDLCFAFFQTPIHYDIQRLFAFTFCDRQYRKTHMQYRWTHHAVSSVVVREVLAKFASPASLCCYNIRTIYCLPPISRTLAEKVCCSFWNTWLTVLYKILSTSYLCLYLCL